MLSSVSGTAQRQLTQIHYAPLDGKYSSDSTTRQEKVSMSNILEQVERTQALAIQAPLLKEVSHIPGRVPATGGMPKVLIQGDIRLRVAESDAALRPIKGHYHIETEGMQEPLQVIW